MCMVTPSLSSQGFEVPPKRKFSLSTGSCFEKSAHFFRFGAFIFLKLMGMGYLPFLA